MKIAVLGVGLIGGSIGLAARRRLDAEVAGFDPDAGTRRRRRSSWARSARLRHRRRGLRRAPSSSSARRRSAALPGLVAEALEATGEGAVVTDVGSTKRLIADALADAPRFVGGHPLAGAETAGVENARADLFEGARWYLTPTPGTEGLALRPPAARDRRAGRPAAGDRRRRPRPADGDGQPPAARARQRPRRAGGRGARGRIGPAARGRPQLSRHDARRRRQPGDLGRHLRHQPRRRRRRDRRASSSASSRRRRFCARATPTRSPPGTRAAGQSRRAL